MWEEVLDLLKRQEETQQALLAQQDSILRRLNGIEANHALLQNETIKNNNQLSEWHARCVKRCDAIDRLMTAKLRRSEEF